MNSLASTFLQRSLADLQRTTMYQLVRKECQKPPQRIIQDNWPRFAVGLLTVYNLYGCLELFPITADYLYNSLPTLVRLVSPQTGTHTHRSAAIVLGVALVGFNAAVILEGLSFITLSLRPSTTIKNNSNNGQITKSDAPLQETHDSKLESVPSLAATAIEQKPSASLWSRVRFPQNFSTLRHAQWMLNYSLFVAACAPFLVGFMRYHYVLPDLWPLIWNDPFWLELMDGFKEGAVSDSSTMTSWRAVWDIMDTTVNAAMTFWSLRVWIRKMEEGKEDNDEK